MADRFILRRTSDGLYFHQPTHDDVREWRPEAHTAHRWVRMSSAASAAWLWNTLKGEQCEVVTLEVTPTSVVA